MKRSLHLQHAISCQRAFEIDFIARTVACHHDLFSLVDVYQAEDAERFPRVVGDLDDAAEPVADRTEFADDVYPIVSPKTFPRRKMSTPVLTRMLLTLECHSPTQSPSSNIIEKQPLGAARLKGKPARSQ